MNDFSRQDIETWKARTDLVELMRSHAIELKPVGRNFTAICPWHEDKEASLVVNPEKQLYNCFGCDAKGDALTFLQAQNNLTFPQAVMKLRELAGDASESPEPSAPVRSGSPCNPQLLKKVAEHYAQGLARSQEARDYLADRSLGDVEALRAFGVGYCDGSLLKTVPKGSEARQQLIDLGVLNSKGKEHFLGCVVVPLEDPELGVVGLYGRRLNPKAKVRHLFLPGPKRGVLNHQVLRTASSVVVVEGVLDAIALWVAGVRNGICLHGTAGFTPDTLEALNASNVRELWLCVDADRAGEEAVERIAEQTQGRFALSRVLLPPGSDPNSILVNEGASSLRSFLDCRSPVSKELETTSTESNPNAGSLPITETTDTGFSLSFESPPVSYQVTPLPPFSGRLRISLRAALISDGRKKRYLDRLDLTSARARDETVKRLCRAFDFEAELAEAHLAEVLETTEEWALAEGESEDGSTEAPVLTEEQKLEALEFLQAPDLVARLQADMEVLGYVGEGKGKLLAYLVGLSRKLENPLSAIIRSQSGAGKSGLSSLVAKLTPPEDVIHYSRVSAHALAYAPKDAFKRKLIIMEERVGGEAADYYIRILQSSHKIRQAVVIKDPATGQMRTQEFEVEGPIAYIETTTDRHLNQENASRCFEIYLDETEQQTQRIHQLQRQARTLQRLKKADQQAILARHHNAQRLLEEVKVVIPYVDILTFPTKWLRTRRDNERFLCLIEVSAFLHQFQRTRKSCRRPDGEEVSYIEANLDDYRLAYELAKDVLRDTLHELSISAREVLQTASSFEGGSFSRRDLRVALAWSQKRVHQAVHELLDMEYLSSVSEANGKAHRYTVVLDDVGHQPTVLSGLLHPDELARRLSKSED
jgi:DNA primase